MKKEKNGSSAFIEKLLTLNISTASKSAAQKLAEKEPSIQCPCGDATMEPTHVFPTPMGKLVRYQHRRRQHDDRNEQSLSA